MIGQLTGGVGRETGKLAQTVAAPFTGDELPVHKIPLAGRLVGSTAGISGQSERFYENIRTLNGIEREVKGLAMTDGDVDGYIDSEPRANLIRLGNLAELQVKKLRESQRALRKIGDTSAASEIDNSVIEVMKNLNTEMRAANR